MNLYIDCRSFQDPEYAHKGIGQHGAYIVSLLRDIPKVTLIPLCDPTLGEPRSDAMELFHAAPQWIADIASGIYLQLSPLTHDTSASVVVIDSA